MAATRSAIAIALLGLASIALAAPSSRILDGQDAVVGQFPFSVSVRVDNVHTSGGSIIGDRFILTSASQVSSLGSTPIAASRVTVRVGSINQYAGGEIVAVDEITIHQSYGSFIHNVAILRLAKALTFSDRIAKIDLAGAEDLVEDGSAVTVTGWGLMNDGSSPYKLQYTSMTVLSRAMCEYQAGYGYESTLCLSHELNAGLGVGDAGAGIVQNNKLVGVASFAFGTGGTKYPDVSSLVSAYAEWIAGVIA